MEPSDPIIDDKLVSPPPTFPISVESKLMKGPNIRSLPEFPPLPDRLVTAVMLKVGDNISTDEIMPAGARVLPFRSNIPAISEFVYVDLDPTYVARVKEREGSHAIVAGTNYGQGSSREHAAIAPRYLGLSLVVALSFARIHWQNLINFGILPLSLGAAIKDIRQGDKLVVEEPARQLRAGSEIRIHNESQDAEYVGWHDLSKRQQDVVIAGGLIPWKRRGKQKRKSGRNH